MLGNRAQGFTLEGVGAALILLGALLFATQSLVTLPTTGGAVDASSEGDLGQQADDILVTAAHAEENDLSTLVRNFSQSQQTFAGAVNPQIGYGPDPPPGDFGVMLNGTFTQRDYFYNVAVIYQGRNASDGQQRVPMVDRGDPSENAVVAEYAVTLYDNQTLTAADASPNVELWEYDTNATNNEDGYYPVPNAVEGPVYNVVEVRVVVW
ncbi:hypothetical protein BRC64_12440 [Halobacteriales archaeon QH_10_67_22]|nr:MAG: hypothetical protein BRC64_12440 [Halobacteriales archaeon QH_10_67_22]